MSTYVPPQCSEQEAGGWEDCTWCAGVMLNNAAHGTTVSPNTRLEYEALRVAGGDGPAEKPGDGSNNGQLRTGIRNRYHWEPELMGPPAEPHRPWADVKAKIAHIGDVAALAGTMAAFPAGHHLRRWDPGFHAGHQVFVMKRDALPRFWWMNPQAPNSYPGEWVSESDVRAFYEGFVGGALFAKVGQLAPPVPPAPPTDVSLWASDVPANVKALDPSGKATDRAFRKLKRRYGTVINLIDLEHAFNDLGWDYKHPGHSTSGYVNATRQFIAWGAKP